MTSVESVAHAVSESTVVGSLVETVAAAAADVESVAALEELVLGLK